MPTGRPALTHPTLLLLLLLLPPLLLLLLLLPLPLAAPRSPASLQL